MSGRILVVDDHEVFRESVSEALSLRGYSVIEAGSVPEALAQVARSGPDLALVDVCMPDYDGIDFLRFLSEKSEGRRLPIMLMTAQARREYIDEAARFGVCDFVVKAAFSMDELVARIEMRMRSDSPSLPPPPPPSLRGRPDPEQPRESERTIPARRAYAPASTASGADTTNAGSRFAQSSAPPSSMPASQFDAQRETEERRRKTSSRSRKLRTLEPVALPGPVGSVLELASSITVGLAQLEAVVRRDPVLAARILGLANSVLFRGSNPSTQLDESLRGTGIDAIVEMVEGLPLAGRGSVPWPGAETLELWRHCLATALVAERLAPTSLRASAHLAGLLHDLPLLMALQVLGEETPSALAEADARTDSPAEAVCKSMGMTEGQVAQVVVERFHLPDAIAAPLRDYHNICLGRQPREPGDVVRRTDTAHHLAVALGFDWDALAEVRPLPRSESRSWRDSDRLVLDLPGLVEEIARHTEDAGLPALPESRPSTVPILYWRDPRWSTPDPLEHVLSRCGALETADSIDSFLGATGVRRVAAIEPDHRDWNRVIAAASPLLVLHMGVVPTVPSGVQAEFVRLPTPVGVLAEWVGRGQA